MIVKTTDCKTVPMFGVLHYRTPDKSGEVFGALDPPEIVGSATLLASARSFMENLARTYRCHCAPWSVQHYHHLRIVRLGVEVAVLLPEKRDGERLDKKN